VEIVPLLSNCCTSASFSFGDDVMMSLQSAAGAIFNAIKLMSPVPVFVRFSPVGPIAVIDHRAFENLHRTGGKQKQLKQQYLPTSKTVFPATVPSHRPSPAHTVTPAQGRSAASAQSKLEGTLTHFWSKITWLASRPSTSPPDHYPACSLAVAAT
jgi:hypothetical protein